MGAIAKEHQIEIPHIDEDAHKLQSLYKYLRRIIKDRTALSNYFEAVILHQENLFVIKRLQTKIKALKKEEEELIPQMLDFITRQSGTSVNTRGRISKQGNKAIRETLFMPVLISINYNTEFKTMFERLKSNSKHTTLAQVAVMRKLILLAYSLYKNNTKYDPERYLKYQLAKKEDGMVIDTHVQ